MLAVMFQSVYVWLSILVIFCQLEKLDCIIQESAKKLQTFHCIGIQNEDEKNSKMKQSKQ